MSEVSQTLPGDFSSDSECSYVTAFEEIPESSSSPVLQENAVGGQGSCGVCKVDVKTQTPFCELCFLRVNEEKSEKRSSETSLSNESASISSLTSVTSSNESYSDIESVNLKEDIPLTDKELKSSPICLDLKTQSNIQPLTICDRNTDQEYLLSANTVRSAESQAKMASRAHEEVMDTRFLNRSINSVARIIVADSVDKVKTNTGADISRQIHPTEGHEEVSRSGQQRTNAWQNIITPSVETYQQNNMTPSGGEYQQNTTPLGREYQQNTTPPVEDYQQSNITPSAGDYQQTNTLEYGKENALISSHLNDTTDLRRIQGAREEVLTQHAIWTIEKLHEMWSGATLCDVLLSTSSGKAFQAHGLILSLHSDFFKHVMTSSSPESHGYWKITLSDSIRDKTMENILHFMYTSLVQINNDTISDLLQASVDLSIHRLTRLCMEFIENISIDNCLMILQIAEKNSLNEHVYKINTFIHENFITISKTEGFLNSPIERVHPILTEDALNVDSEIDVFLAAKRWAQRNQDAEMKAAAAVMNAIRFELFSPEELAKHVESVDWLMEIQEVRVQVLEAFRYLSLAASPEARLRPPSPKRRGLRTSESISKRHIQSKQLDNSTCDVSTAMSRFEGVEQDTKTKHNVATSISGKLFSTNGVPVSPRSQQHIENQVRSATNTALFSTNGVPVSPRSKQQIDHQVRSATSTALPRSESGIATKLPTQARSGNREITMNSHQGSIQPKGSTHRHGVSIQSHRSPKASKTAVSSMSGKLSYKTSNISQKSKDIKKPLSDYRITSANPKALFKGPKAWPTPKNLLPSGAEDGASDLIVTSGGVSITGDVDRPGKVLEIYDPKRNQWRDCIDAPVARNHHVVVFLQDSLYIIGGSDPHGHGPDFIKPVNTVYCYDLRLARWTKASPMKSTRIFHQASALLGQLYVVGGQNHKGRTLSSVETYTPITDTWRQIRPISTPRYAVAMATHGQRLWVAGGYCEESGSEMVSTVEYFNPYSEEWTKVTPLRSARCHANLLVARGHLYVIGGYVVGQHGVVKHSTIDVYDEDEKKWIFVTEMEHGRHDGKTVAWHDKLFVFGARSDDDEERPLPRIDYFDTVENNWKIHSSDLSSARFGHACCIIPAKSATNWL